MKKIKMINIDAIKNRTLKLCIGIVLGTTILTGCAKDETQIEQEQIHYPIEVTYTNVDSTSYNDEVVVVYNSKGEIYTTLDIKGETLDESNSVSVESYVISNEDLRLAAHYLDKEVQLPQISENEKYEVVVDYMTKDISVEVEKLGLEK